jgi:hypothetical protein
MRKIAYFAAIGALVALSAAADTAQAQAAASSAQGQSGASASSSTPAEDPLAAAARKAKEQKANQAAKPAKVFTNDNIPTTGSGISTVGAKPAGSSANSGTASAPSSNQEAVWKDRFAKLREKLDQDTSDLAVMQRELGVLNTQNYTDPVQAMQQGYTRGDIQKKTDEISAKQKAIDADKQAIDDAEEDLRKSGGDAGWAR